VGPHAASVSATTGAKTNRTSEDEERDKVERNAGRGRQASMKTSG
jgi:hypothetical protein